MTVTTLDVLRLARKKIGSPEAWTKEAFARDALGEELVAVDDFKWWFTRLGSYGQPTCFCLGGALGAAAHELRVADDDAYAAVYATIAANPSFEAVPDDDDMGAVFRWNDAPDRTYQEIVAALDETIERVNAR